MNLKQYLDTLSVEQIKKDVLVLCERCPEARVFFEDKIKERNSVQTMAGEGVPEAVKILGLSLTSGNFYVL